MNNINNNEEEEELEFKLFKQNTEKNTIPELLEKQKKTMHISLKQQLQQQNYAVHKHSLCMLIKGTTYRRSIIRLPTPVPQTESQRQ